MKRLSGVGARLGLALFVVLAAALALVYAIVVPSLESRLVNSRVAQVKRAAAGIARELPANRAEWPDFLENAATSANARAVVFDYAGPPSALLVVGDSHGSRSSDVENNSLALRSAVAVAPISGTVRHNGERFAEAASPVADTNEVVLVQAPLHEALTTVRLTRNRLLLAGGLALIAALTVGYVGAWLFAGRLRRLEAAADRIAAGRFDEPIVDSREDEVGQLARSFDRMRERLATLEHARREFVANASHELRTPLFSLGGFLELMRDEELDDGTRREFLATMQEQVERLAKLATELLDLSRVDAGELRVAREPLELASIAEAVTEEFAAIARAGGHSLSTVVEESTSVLGDEQRVLQISRALVENALVHTPSGTRVQIRVRDGALAVEDDGPGISGEHVDRIFDRFYRAEGRVASGSGLGLAIARELAEAMGGSLELESKPGRTRFRLHLPFDEPLVRAPTAAPGKHVKTHPG
jgi:signal transduction histidine kinase